MKNFLIDMDGVLVLGKTLIPGADQFIDRLLACGRDGRRRRSHSAQRSMPRNTVSNNAAKPFGSVALSMSPSRWAAAIVSTSAA